MMPPDECDNEEGEVCVEDENEGEEQEAQRRPMSVSDMVDDELLAQGRELRRQAASSSDGPANSCYLVQNS